MSGWDAIPDAEAQPPASASGWDAVPDSGPQAALTKPREESGFFGKLKKKAVEIYETGKKAKQELATSQGWTDLGIGALEAASKGTQMLGHGVIAAGSTVGNKLGLVSDDAHELTLQAILDMNEGEGSAYAMSEADQRNLREAQQTAAYKTGAVLGEAAPMMVSGGAAGGLKVGAQGLLKRGAIRAAQGAMVNAPNSILGTGIRGAADTNKTGGQIFTDIAKREALDAGFGALFSNRVNKVFDGSTPAGVFAARAAKTGAIGTGMAAGEATLGGGEGTWTERFGEALPGSLAMTAAMEAPHAFIQARGVGLDNRARAQFAAEEARLEASRPQRELDAALADYHATTAELEGLRAQENLRLGADLPDPSLFENNREQQKLVAQHRVRFEQEAQARRSQIANAEARLESAKGVLRERGVEPWLTPEEAPRVWEGDPEGARLNAEAQAAYEAQFGIDTTPGRPVVLGGNQPVDLTPAQPGPVLPAQPYSSQSGVSPRLGPNQPVEMAPPAPQAADPYASSQSGKPVVQSGGKSFEELMRGPQQPKEAAAVLNPPAEPPPAWNEMLEAAKPKPAEPAPVVEPPKAAEPAPAKPDPKFIKKQQKAIDNAEGTLLNLFNDEAPHGKFMRFAEGLHKRGLLPSETLEALRGMKGDKTYGPDDFHTEIEDGLRQRGMELEAGDVEGIQFLNSGLNLKQMASEWWKGKGQERTITLPDGREVAYKVNAKGQIEFHTDAQGKPLEAGTMHGHKFWQGLTAAQRDEALRIAANNGKTNDPQVARAVLLATQKGGLHPDVEALGPFKALRDSFESTWSPGSSSDNASTARDIARQRMAERVFEQGRISRLLEADAERFKDASLTDFKRIMDYMEGRGGKLPPEDMKMVEKLRKELAVRRDELIKLGILEPGQAVNDYFGRAWQQGDEGQLMRDSNRPLEGKKSFAQGRTFEGGDEALREAYLPETYNPVEMLLWKMRQMDKAIAGRKTINELQEKGLVLKKGSEGIGDDWVKVNGLGGDLVADPKVAKVLNNMMSPGLRGGRMYDTMMTLNNALNQAQLGASGFHAGFVAMDSGVSRAAQGVQKMKTAVKTKDSGMALEALQDFGMASTVVAPAIENTVKGWKILKSVKAGEVSPEVKFLLEGGMHFEMDPMYKSGMVDKFKQNIHEAKLAKDAGANGQLMKAVGKAAAQAPFAGLEKAFTLIGEKFVPAVKAAAAVDLAKYELKRLGPNATIEQRRAAARKVVDSIDNRMGQLAYDNLFWDRRAKDMAHLAVRSVGWNLGTARELGGGVRDIVKSVGGGEFTHAASYTVALPVMTAWAAILYQSVNAFLRGQPTPKIDTKTLMGFARSGETAPTGEEELDQMPGYMGDVWKVSRHPLATLGHKTGPLVNAAKQMLLDNKDFYGNMIIDPAASRSLQLKQAAKFMGEQFIPFYVRNADKITKEHGFTPGRLATSFMGINPAPSWVNKTEAENQMAEFSGIKSPAGGRDYYERARKENRTDRMALVNKANAGDAEALAKIRDMGNTRELNKEFQFVGRQSEAVRAARDTRSFQGLNFPQAAKVFSLATPDERKVWENQMRRKALVYSANRKFNSNAVGDEAYESLQKILTGL